MQSDVAAYYNQTQNHYRRWWQLGRAMALHYGLWDNNTRNFYEALQNTNRYLARLADVRPGWQVLDAGCGVGGSAIFLAHQYQARVLGITLSNLQVDTARQNARHHRVEELVAFRQLNFCQTGLPSESFDLVWACESSSSAPDKAAMAREWYRLLRPGGRLVLSDFFKTRNNQPDPGNLLQRWQALWAMSDLLTIDSLIWYLEQAGFKVELSENLTSAIEKTARRMFWHCLAGILPSITYNLLFGARRYARHHYKSGIYQYRALKQGLWQYQALVALKPARASSR